MVITYAAESAGLDIGVSFVVACIVCVWLMCNEIISILENMVDIGVKLPPFLLKITKRLQNSVEKSADIDTNDEEVDDNG